MVDMTQALRRAIGKIPSGKWEISPKVIKTSSGEITFHSGVVAFWPTTIALVRLHELYLRSQGFDQGFSLTETEKMPPEVAAEAYSAAVAGALGQIAAASPARRLELAVDILQGVREINRTAGLEFLILSSGIVLEEGGATVAELEPAGTGQAPAKQKMDPALSAGAKQLLISLFDEVPEIWDAIAPRTHAVADSTAVSSASAGALDAGQREYLASRVPILDAVRSNFSTVSKASVRGLFEKGGFGSSFNLSDELQSLALEKQSFGMPEFEQIFAEADVDRCKAAYQTAGAVAGAVIGLALGGPAGAVEGAQAGKDAGEIAGGFLCGGGGSDSADNSSKEGKASNSSSETKPDAGQPKEEVKKPESYPSPFVTLVKTDTWMDGPGLKSLLVSTGASINLAALPQIADSQLSLKSAGILASIPDIKLRVDLGVNKGRILEIARQIEKVQIRHT
ncbi:hypothetical protein ABZ613_29000 [Streptomyces collinus]|uniref:hypothetical protein n=1 Tax=Streptomyces collinus TaxID=42684 RepID=UPI0033D841C2